MPNIDNLKIPAYQRKRSLAAKARAAQRRTARSTSYFARKTTRIRKTAPISRTSRIIRPNYDEPFTDIPIKSTLPSQELFPNPLELEEEIEEQSSSVREMKICGICEGYFNKIEVAIIKVTSPIREGNIIIFEKEGGLFEQKVESMQINRRNITLARSGDDIGIKVTMEPKVGTPVYKVI